MSQRLVERIGEIIKKLKDKALRDYLRILEVPAVNPSMGGKGEYERAKLIQSILENYGLEVERFDAEDSRVPEGFRPNIVSRLEGEEGRTLWVVAHMDTVPEGDRALWETDPFKPVVKNGKIIARGAEDNGQGIISAILAAAAIKHLGLKPKLGFALAFVSDEEAGSKYGIQHLINLGVFKREDLVIVPDYGSPDGRVIEIAEKSLLWMKVKVRGKQTHASTPYKGLNAHRIGMRFAVMLDDVLHDRFPAYDPLFDPSPSTFEPTKKEKNIDNINTIPGTDALYFDCRILPSYGVDEVLKVARESAEAFGKMYGAEIIVEEVLRFDAPPPTPPDSEVVARLRKSLKLSRNIEAEIRGIGGGTCAAFFRKAGMHAAVWSTIDQTAHQPNEYCKVENILKDAEVFALAALL